MKYCAFLRGVNVNGTSMKMAEVCSVFTDAGIQEVSSVLASGNILFASDKDPAELKAKLEKAMATHFDYEAFLFIRNDKEVIQMVADNPFENHADYHTYVFIGQKEVEKELLEHFNSSTKGLGEQAAVVNGTFYWQVAKGNTLDSQFGKILGRKTMKDKMTSRNINTVVKIEAKLTNDL